ncbi:MAG: RAMP superfamily CRISPR-associated protein [Archaeoglobaceae archaeon]
MHEALKARNVLECSLKTLSPLHVGSEKTLGFGVDNPIVKVKRKENGEEREIPVIPGSSIRGVLRAHFYRLARSGALSKFEWFKVLQEELEKFERDFAKCSEVEKIRNVKEKLGTLEKFFGISGLASPLKITDAEPIDFKTGSRTHVRIDPKKDRAEKRKFFTVEFVEGIFKFKIVFDELSEDYEDVNRFFNEVFCKTLKNGLEIHVGGMRSRGYGFCELKVERILRYTAEGLAFGKFEEVK